MSQGQNRTITSNAGQSEMHAGTFRHLAVTHFVDPATSLNIIRDAGGRFLSAWRLSEAQLAHVLRDGNLGGGK